MSETYELSRSLLLERMVLTWNIYYVDEPGKRLIVTDTEMTALVRVWCEVNHLPFPERNINPTKDCIAPNIGDPVYKDA